MQKLLVKGMRLHVGIDDFIPDDHSKSICIDSYKMLKKIVH
jgi:hypothetical protein